MDTNANNNKINDKNVRLAKYYNYYQSDEYKKNYAEYEKKRDQALKDMRLENSMGTQTDVLKKPSYKELASHPFIARITAQLEMNDHNGYCSDEDCEYTRKIIKAAAIIVPEQYRSHPVGQIENTMEYKWANHFLIPEVKVKGSGYCNFVKPEGGLGQHEYRYTIKKVEIVENKKYNKVETKKVKEKKKKYVKPVICYDRFENQGRRNTNINTAYCPDYGDNSQGRQCRGW